MAPLQIHILDIVSRDQKVLVENESSMEVEYLDHDDSSDDEVHKGRYSRRFHTNKATERTEMLLHIFGSTLEGGSVRIDVTGFTPFFYIRIPDGMGDRMSEAKSSVQEYLLDNMNKRLVEQIKIEPMKREVLYQFTANELFPFLKLTMPSLACYRTVRNLFLNAETQLPHNPTFKPLGAPFQGPPKIYEANLDPLLRFLHLQDLAPCGWVTFETLDHTDLEEQADGTLTGTCEYTHVHPCSVAATAPFSIVSWDIECFSASGDFPIACKKYGNVIKPILEQSATPADFGARFVDAIFGPAPTIRLTNTTLKREAIMKYVLSEECMNLVMSYTSRRAELKMSEKQEILRSIGAHMDKYLGRYTHPEGDPVIQIGNVVRTLGSDTRSEKHLFVLGSCEPMEGIQVHAYKTEARMILGWCAWIGERNPDMMIGYNIFGFDSRYVWERAKEVGLITGDGWRTEVVDAILRLSRLAENGGAVRLEEKFLSSSALGDNFMHVILMQGRLQIDLYNYVKRNFNLPSYKLDEVTKNFMSGKHTSLILEGAHMRLGVGKKVAEEVGVGRSIVFLDSLGESLTEKLVVLEVVEDTLILDGSSLTHDTVTPFHPEDAARWVVVKDDVSPQELFVLHRGTAADRATIGRYCIQDCELVLDLFKKLDVFNNAMSMANVCSVPVNYIFSRGQGIKCESLIFKVCHQKNKAIEVLPAPAQRFRGGATVTATATATATEEAKDDDDEVVQQVPQGDDSYEGAIVLEPKPGFYVQSPVGVCDFASLYPSTIISENISHDSLVWIRDYDAEGTKIADVFGSTQYDRMPEISYTDIEFDLLRPDPADTRKNPTKVKVGTRVCRYAQGRQGTIPEILEGLLAQRKATRELIKKERDPFRIALLDAKQNAYKVTANSLYGQLGSGTFKVRLQSLAASVTAYGRKQILFAKAAIENFYGPAANDPRCAAECSAEIVYGDSVTGYTPILIRRNGHIEIVPIEELVGGHANWTTSGEKDFCTVSGVESWTETGWTPIERVIRHTLVPTKKILRVVTHTGIVDVTDDHSLLKPDGTEISPKDLSIGDALLHHDYPVGETTIAYESFEDRFKQKNLCVSIFEESNWQMKLAKVAFIASLKGYDIHFDIDIFCVRMMGAKSATHQPTVIKKLYEIPYRGYVYDLTTTNHHFQAGVGKMIVHNTDSLFVNFNVKNPLTGVPLQGRDAIEATIRLTEEAGTFVTRVLKPPHNFEFDKVYWPFLIFSKKRYIGNMYEEDADHFKQAFMGVALKRRDYAQIVKTIYGGAIQILLNQRDIPAAVKFVRQCANDLVEGKYGIGQLIISKSIRAEYANPLGIAHKVLADRIAARDPGNAPSAGDRIPFVYITTPPGTPVPKLQGDRIETPQFLKEHGLTPDYMFYIEHQIANPICQMFGILLDAFPEMRVPGVVIPIEQGEREKKAYELLFGEAIAIHKAKETETLLRLGITQEVPPPKKKRAAVGVKAVGVKAVATAKRGPATKKETVDTYYADLAVVKVTTARKRKAQKEQKEQQSDGAK